MVKLCWITTHRLFDLYYTDQRSAFCAMGSAVLTTYFRRIIQLHSWQIHAYNFELASVSVNDKPLVLDLVNISICAQLNQNIPQGFRIVVSLFTDHREEFEKDLHPANLLKGHLTIKNKTSIIQSRREHQFGLNKWDFLMVKCFDFMRIGIPKHCKRRVWIIEIPHCFTTSCQRQCVRTIWAKYSIHFKSFSHFHFAISWA